MTTIVVAAGLCSAIRPKLLTAFPEKRYPNIKITAWGEGHWHMPVPDNMIMPDDDPWVKRHFAKIDVWGAPSFAKWVEYIACRAIAIDNGRAGNMYLLSNPLNPDNLKWAARWDTLPAAGEMRQASCKHKPPTQQAQQQTTKQQTRQRPARRRTNARQRQQDSGLLGTVVKLFRGG